MKEIKKTEVSTCSTGPGTGVQAHREIDHVFPSYGGGWRWKNVRFHSAGLCAWLFLFFFLRPLLLPAAALGVFHSAGLCAWLLLCFFTPASSASLCARRFPFCRPLRLASFSEFLRLACLPLLPASALGFPFCQPLRSAFPFCRPLRLACLSLLPASALGLPVSVQFQSLLLQQRELNFSTTDSAVNFLTTDSAAKSLR